MLLEHRLKVGADESASIKFLSCDNRGGLRMRTIRLAFLRSAPLMQSIKPPVLHRYEQYTLQGMRLVLFWHEVIYYFIMYLIWNNIKDLCH